MARQRAGADRLLDQQPASRHAPENAGQAGKDETEDRARLPGTKDRARLDHFEGRPFNGFRRRLTRAIAAHLFITRKRLATPKAQTVTQVLMAS